MNYWQFKLPINRWANIGSEFDELEIGSKYTQKIQDQKNMPCENIGDVVIVHNTTKGTTKIYPDGIYLVCTIKSKIYYNEDYDDKGDEKNNCIDLKVIYNLKNNPIALESLGFKEFGVKVNKLGVNGSFYLFKHEDKGSDLLKAIEKEIKNNKVIEDINTIIEKSCPITETKNDVLVRLGQG